MHAHSTVRAALVAALVYVSSLAHAQTPITQYPISGVTPPIFGLPTSAVNGGGSVTASLIPTPDNTLDLGSATFRWRSIYWGTQALGPDGTAAAPPYSFASEPGSGWYRPGSGELTASVSGAPQVSIIANIVRFGSGTALGWSSNANPTLSGSDTILSRGAANRLDLATGDSFYVVSGGVGIATAPTATSWLTTGAGTTTVAPVTITNGTNLTNAAANVIENDGAAFYKTQDTTNGRTYWDGWNYFRLTGSGTGITSIADFFGATGSGIPLVANGVYEVEWNAYFSQATAGTATWTIVTATTALANLTGEYVCSNIAGIQAVGAPQTAGINVTASSSTAFPVTGTEATGVTHYCRIRVLLTAGNGASNTRLRLTMSAGTATPLINSYFRVRRLPSGNVGTFVS